MFSGNPSAVSLRLFIWTDLVIMIYHERLEQSYKFSMKLREYSLFTSPC